MDHSAHNETGNRDNTITTVKMDHGAHNETGNWGQLLCNSSKYEHEKPWHQRLNTRACECVCAHVFAEVYVCVCVYMCTIHLRELICVWGRAGGWVGNTEN